MHESDRLFIDLQPPPGGLQRLQRRLAQRSDHTARQRGFRIAGAGAFAMSLLALAWLLPGVIVRHRETTELASALRDATTPPANGIQVVDGVAIELPSGQTGVRLYLVQSVTPSPRTSRN